MISYMVTNPSMMIYGSDAVLACLLKKIWSLSLSVLNPKNKIKPMFCQHSRRHASTQHIFLAFFWLAMANSAINPLIYFQMNAKWDLMEEAFVVL